MIEFKSEVKVDLEPARAEYERLVGAQARYAEGLRRAGEGAGNVETAESAGGESEHRRGAGACPMTGWLTLPEEFPETELEQIETAAREIRGKYRYLVCIGIGGSYLGHRALIEVARGGRFLAGFSRENTDAPKVADAPDASRAEDSAPGVKVLYAGNSLSPLALLEVLNEVEGADFAINVISKSGTTTEPAVAFRIFREKLVQKWGEQGAAERIFVTTDREKGALHDEAVAKGYRRFVVPDDIGGRYSVLSAVGLLPLAAGGVDVRKLLAGAEAEAKALKTGASTVALEYAAVRQKLAQNHHTEVLTTAEPAARYLEYWWEQLFGESEGKDGKGIFPTSLVYTTDLHSLGQYMQQGRRDIFETVLRFRKYGCEEVVIPESADDADGLGYLAGRDLAYVNEQAVEATIAAHEAGGIPVLQVMAPDFTEESLGALVYFFEVACAVSARISGVNPFDQPGVEAYKMEMFRRLGKPGY